MDTISKLSALQVYKLMEKTNDLKEKKKRKKKRNRKNSHPEHPEKKLKIESKDTSHDNTNTKIQQKNTTSNKKKKRKISECNGALKSDDSVTMQHDETQSAPQITALKDHAYEPFPSNSDSDNDMEEEPWHNIDTIEHGKNLFQSILGTMTIGTFFENYWEKKPLYIPARSTDQFEDWFSCEELDNILTTEKVNFTEHLDATSYENGVRETHNPEGRAYRPVVWDLYRSGCSIRMLCPQAFYYPLRMKLNFLQEYFGCFVGSNIYLTPPKSQGFAPHYDDIEAFVLQLEGTKHWRVYAPRHKGEQLPQYSSPNFSNDEIGKPILEKTLNPGDVLYFPRGFIHQADCPDNEHHSLHITVSTYQKHSWGDLLKKTLTRAIDKAMKEDLEFRKGLPIGFLTYTGRSHARIKTASRISQRDAFKQKFKQLTNRLCSLHMPVDLGCDELGKSLVYDSLPPILEASEAAVHVTDQGETWISDMNQVCNVVELTPDTKIRLVRWSAVRAVESTSEEGVAVYHCADNTNIYHEVEPQPMNIEKEMLPAFDRLVTDFPAFTKIEDLPLNDLDEKMTFAASLYDRGLVITEGYLPLSEDNPTEC